MICHHDYNKPKRLGRANYACSKCGADISLQVILIEDAKHQTVIKVQLNSSDKDGELYDGWEIKK